MRTSFPGAARSAGLLRDQGANAAVMEAAPQTGPVESEARSTADRSGTAPGATRPRVLIVDDEPRYVRLVTVNLTGSGYDVLAARDGRSAIAIAAAERPDVILLDIGLPVMDGWEACRRVREFSNAPIIMLTAKAGEADKVRGLDAGADDYLTKPFGPAELLARIRAVLRRSRMPADGLVTPTFTLGSLRLDFVQHQVWVADRPVTLSPTEYRLLAELARNAGRVVLTETLLQRIWGPEYAGETQHVRLYISRLRQKLGDDPDQPQFIVTRPGVGYMMRAVSDAP